MRLRGLVPLAVLAAALTSCGWTDDIDPYRPPAQETAEADGSKLYARDCAWCHGAGALGTPRGPSLVTGTNGPALTHFVLSTGRMPLDDPQEKMVRGPSFYGEEETLAIVEYLDDSFSQPGPDIPRIETVEPTAVGAELYLGNCAACHATTGIGAAMNPSTERQPFPSGVTAPPILESTPQQVAEAIRTGPGAMPVFGEGFISDEELGLVVSYVQYLQRPKDEGGAPIGRIGPVVEGAVGWLVGIVLLLLFTRWIGTKMGEE